MNKESVKINFRRHNCELTKDRVRATDVPGKYVYNIRHDDNEQPCTWTVCSSKLLGTLISDTEIDLSDGSPYDHYSILSQSEIDELDETMNEIIFS